MKKNKQYKIIFMGTPQFSVPILSGLIDNYDVVAVVTQPDKKVGRKQKIVPSPIKELALENKIKVLQPERVKSNTAFIERIKDLSPDLIVVAAYGFILPQELLEIPKYAVINVHASLLPKYRGPSPIQTVILNGDNQTGVTIMLVNAKMDEGDILSQQQADIADNETFVSLHDKLSILGAHLLIDTLPKYLNKEISPQKQDDKKATYCKLITKEDGRIDWSQPAQKIERQVRALNPWPGTWTEWDGRILKISAVMLNPVEVSAEIGEVFKYDNKLVVICGKGALQIEKLQLEGKNSMTAKEFLNGYPSIIKQILK